MKLRFDDLVNELNGSELLLKGSDSLDLGAPGKAWYLRSGRVAVFAAKTRANGPTGARTFLFEVGAGDVLFGLGSEGSADTLALEAVPIEETRAFAFSSEALGHLTEPTRVALAHDVLESWIGRCVDLLAEVPPAIQPVLVGYGEPVSLPEGQTCRPERELLWCALKAGTASWLGRQPPVLDEATGAFPIGSKLWLRADSPIEVIAFEPGALTHHSLSAGTRAFYRFVIAQLHELLDQAEVEIRARFFERVERDRQIRESAIASLADMLNPKRQDAPDFTGTPLFAAASAVGHALGIDLRPPARSEAGDDSPGLVEAIARASHVRTRSILLSPRFWLHDCGPLLAFLSDGMVPVALLRSSSKGYVIFNPQNQDRVPLTDDTARTLHHRATMFYKALPESRLDAPSIFRFAANGRSREFLHLVAVGLLWAILGMFTPHATGILIDQAIPDSNQGLLLQLGGGLLAAALGMAIFQAFQGVIILRLETLADATLQAAVWDRVLALGAPFFKRYAVGDLNARIMAISQIRQKLSGTTMHTIFTCVFSLLNLGLMFMYHVKLALLACLLALVAICVTLAHCYLKLNKTRPLRRIEGTIFGQVVQVVGGVNKLRVTGSEGRAFSQWGRMYRDKQALVHGIQSTENSLAIFNQVFPGLSAIVIFYMASKGMPAGQVPGPGELSTGSFLAFNAAFGIFIAGATSLSNTVIDLLDVGDLWRRAKPILDEPLEVASSKTDPGSLTGGFALDRVSFRYEGSDRLILSDVSLHADPGEHIALVGPSGCGKSTLFRLLLGFEVPESGVISLDGQELSRLDLRAIRRQMGVVLQTAKLMAGSVFENIACGALISYEAAWEAARKAGFDDDIRKMPMAMHTMVAEGGSNFSGGQRQRLILARAFALKPKIMLLDEATSALDNQSQAIVSQSLNESRITRVSIAHRLSTIRQADRIYVLEAGRIVEVGTFDELMAQDGLFARLAAYQAL